MRSYARAAVRLVTGTLMRTSALPLARSCARAPVRIIALPLARTLALPLIRMTTPAL